MFRRSVALATLLLSVMLGAAPSWATQFRRITSNPGRESDPAPSPDGKWLAFSSDRGGSSQIWVMPIGGGPARPVTSEPDSQTVRDPSRPDTMITIKVRASTPTWAPDSKSILFISTRTGRNNIYSIPLQGGKARALASPIGNNRFAVYSPDGTKIAFYSNRLEPGNLFSFQVYVMDAAGETAEHMARQLTRGDGSPGHPTWSPDGRWIAYVSKTIDTTKTVDVGKGMQMQQNALFATYKVFKSPSAGGPMARVSANVAGGADFEDTWPSWSPTDPRWIAAGRRVGAKQNIWIIDTATGRGFPLTESGSAGKPTWTRDGKAIYYAVTVSKDNEDIWVATDLTLRPPPPGRTAPPRSATGSSKKTPSGGSKTVAK
jgi:Tol biopolymer transport system component